MVFLDKIKNIVRFAEITGPADNAADFPVQQMRFKDKVVNALQLFPYGFYANASSNDSLSVMFSIDGNEANRVSMPYTPQRRPKDLEQNEIAIYHPYTNSFIKLRNNGDLEIDSVQGGNTGNIIINCENATVNVNNDVSVNCGNDAGITAVNDVNIDCTNANVSASSSATVDSPQTTITGDLDANGITSLNGGPAIARVGDSVQVQVTSGSSAGIYNGTITSGGANTSA